MRPVIVRHLTRAAQLMPVSLRCRSEPPSPWRQCARPGRPASRQGDEASCRGGALTPGVFGCYGSVVPSVVRDAIEVELEVGELAFRLGGMPAAFPMGADPAGVDGAVLADRGGPLLRCEVLGV